MTTITSTIGTNGRDYSTLALWAASLPANLVTAGNAYVGECYNDSEFTGTATLLTLSGHTTSATCNITLTAAAGQGFADNTAAQTNALAYNAANGVGIRTTGSYAQTIVCSDANVVFSRLQVKSGGASHAYAMTSTGASALVDGCILEGFNAVATAGYILEVAGSSSLVRNCLVFNATDGALVELSGSGTRFANCIFAKPAGGSVGIIYQNYATSSVFENCGFFGSSVLESGHGTWAPTYTSCATDSAIASPPAGCASTAYSTATFANITSATHDYRLVSGSGLVDAGTADTTDIPAAIDIVGTSRPQGTAWDIGCWELVSGGTSITLSGVAATSAAAALTPSASSAPLGIAATAGAAGTLAAGASGVGIAAAASAGAATLAASVAAGLSGAAATGQAQSPSGGALPGVAAAGTAAALGIVSEINLSPAASYGIAGPVSGYVPALVADPVFIARGPSLRFIARGPALRFTAIGRVGMRTNDLSPPIAAKAETRTVTFDFGPQLAAGVTLTAIEAMNASVHWGYADPTPDANWQGAAQIIASPTTGAAAQAVAQIYGNVPGATVYLLQCEAAASDGTMPVLETTLTSYVPS